MKLSIWVAFLVAGACVVGIGVLRGNVVLAGDGVRMFAWAAIGFELSLVNHHLCKWKERRR